MCLQHHLFLLPSGHEVKLWKEDRPNVFLLCLLLVPPLLGHAHPATVNNENSIMFSLNFCLLAAMTKITLQLSFATGIPSQSLTASQPCGAAAPEYFKQESDRAICYQESPNEGRAPPKGSELLFLTPAKQLSIWSFWDFANDNCEKGRQRLRHSQAQMPSNTQSWASCWVSAHSVRGRWVVVKSHYASSFRLWNPRSRYRSSNDDV